MERERESSPPILFLSEEEGLACVWNVYSSVYLSDGLRQAQFMDVLWVALHQVIPREGPHSDACQIAEHSHECIDFEP